MDECPDLSDGVRGRGWREERGPSSQPAQASGLANLTGYACGGSAALIPWGSGQKEAHTTPVGHASENQSRSDKAAEAVKSGMHPRAKNDPTQHQHSGGNPHLALQRQARLSSVDRQTRRLPRQHTAVQNRQIPMACRRQRCGRLFSAVAAPADNDNFFASQFAGQRAPLHGIKRN